MLEQSKTIQHCKQYVQTCYRFMYPRAERAYGELVGEILDNVLGLIARSDAPYHNLDHTLQVVLVGQEILQGRQRARGDISPESWLNFVVALICHDVGYCQGACRDDQLYKRHYSTGQQPEQHTTLPLGASDAGLSAFHVDRSKLFVEEQFIDEALIDVPQVQEFIERTRLLMTPPDPKTYRLDDLPGLAQAADLIGQLGDPAYLSKMAALFQEFEETGSNRALGYKRVEDMRSNYPKFYWNIASPYVYQGVRYLELTQQGRSVLSNLYRNVTTVEQELTQPAVKTRMWR